MTEYRSDDVSRGVCPHCGRVLAALDVAGRGVCEEHGRVFADWEEGLFDEEHHLLVDPLLETEEPLEVSDDEG